MLEKWRPIDKINTEDIMTHGEQLMPESESGKKNQTEVQLPAFQPIVEESVDQTREQPALGSQESIVLDKISVVCECGYRHTVEAKLAGRIASCPRCKRKITIPSAPSDASD